MTHEAGEISAPVALLRHTLATLAYRSAKTLPGAPEDFADFRAGEGVRTPVEIVAHLGDLLTWALSFANGAPQWTPSPPLPWDRACDRYFAALAAVDRRLASGETLGRSPEKIFQAPIADALSHTGQLALLRRIFGAPIRGENFYVASIVAGRIGPDQEPPKSEFD